MAANRQRVTLPVNGTAVEREVAPRRSLADFLREDLELTGTHLGCEHGICGACTVLLDGVPVRSCILYAVQVDGASVTTVEGLSPDGKHPLQQAWVAEQAPQCGYCQSGQIMEAAALLARNPKPTREEIVAGMNGHICRCITYHRIIRAIERVASAPPGAKIATPVTARIEA